jgi:biopolymer transport protein ExbD
MRVSSGKVAESVLINVTPLIDVIFVILIFLVSCSEMSRMERLEEVILPQADMANPDQGDEVDRWVVNLGEDGKALVEGEAMEVSSPRFRSILAMQANAKRKPGEAFSDQALVIRAHRRMPFQYVQQLILQCQRLKLWKVKLQVVLPEAELKKVPAGEGG